MKGFSLIDLIITMAIMSLLIGLGSMSLQLLFERQKNDAIALRIFHTLAFARSEAIKTNQVVGVCGSQDFKHCSSDWSQGYMVFILHDKTLRILRVEESKSSQPVHSHNQTMIKYSGNGRCLSRSTLHIGDHQKIVIYDSGRARIESFNV